MPVHCAGTSPAGDLKQVLSIHVLLAHISYTLAANLLLSAVAAWVHRVATGCLCDFLIGKLHGRCLQLFMAKQIKLDGCQICYL